MNNVLKVSTVLSWINLIVWGLFAGILALSALSAGNLLILLFAVLFSAIALHSYASIKLQKSIRDPAIPLNRQTSTGIRFIGLIALFFGICFFVVGQFMLRNTHDVVNLMKPQMPPEYKEFNLYSLFFKLGIFYAVSGASIAVNVFLSFRLLRWYLFLRENDIN